MLMSIGLNHIYMNCCYSFFTWILSKYSPGLATVSGLMFVWFKLYQLRNVILDNLGRVWGYHKSKKFHLLNLCSLM